jgi:hypothetical protein
LPIVIKSEVHKILALEGRNDKIVKEIPGKYNYTGIFLFLIEALISPLLLIHIYNPNTDLSTLTLPIFPSTQYDQMKSYYQLLKLRLTQP